MKAKFIEIKDISHSIDLLNALAELAASKFEYFLIALVAFIVNYFYYYC